MPLEYIYDVPGREHIAPVSGSSNSSFVQRATGGRVGALGGSIVVSI
jgi:hypothetical protein